MSRCFTQYRYRSLFAPCCQRLILSNVFPLSSIGHWDWKPIARRRYDSPDIAGGSQFYRNFEPRIHCHQSLDRLHLCLTGIGSPACTGLPHFQINYVTLNDLIIRTISTTMTIDGQRRNLFQIGSTERVRTLYRQRYGIVDSRAATFLEISKLAG